MSLDVSFHEDARTEFDEAASFYAMESASLGLAFVDAVEHAVARACDYPDSCPIVRGVSGRCVFTDSRTRWSTRWSTGFGYSPLRTIVGDRSTGAAAGSGCGANKRVNLMRSGFALDWTR